MADYNDRIVIYLKAPGAGSPALIESKKFNVRGDKSDVTNFTNKVPVKSGEEVRFLVSAVKTIDAKQPGVADLYCVMVYWPDGCRIMSHVLLGEKGNNVGDTIGVGYTDTGAPACSRLYCRFNGAGVLTFEDRQGVTMITDVAKPGNVALCLAVVAGAGSIASVTFPDGECTDWSV